MRAERHGVRSRGAGTLSRRHRRVGGRIDLQLGRSARDTHLLGRPGGPRSTLLAARWMMDVLQRALLQRALPAASPAAFSPRRPWVRNIVATFMATSESQRLEIVIPGSGPAACSSVPIRPRDPTGRARDGRGRRRLIIGGPSGRAAPGRGLRRRVSARPAHQGSREDRTADG